MATCEFPPPPLLKRRVTRRFFYDNPCHRNGLCHFIFIRPTRVAPEPCYFLASTRASTANAVPTFVM